jgi:hypothetical protein
MHGGISGLVGPFWFYLIGFGILLIVFVFYKSQASHRTNQLSAMSSVGLAVSFVYVIAGFLFVFSIPKPDFFILPLGGVLTVLSIGLIRYFSSIKKHRVYFTIGYISIFVALNIIKPTFVDFTVRDYVDNLDELATIEFSTPNHWREMLLEDGKVFLNLNSVNEDERNKVFKTPNRVKSPIFLDKINSGKDEGLYFVSVPEVTKGTNGYRHRPNALLQLSVLSKTILKYKASRAGTAQLLNGRTPVDSKFLWDAVGRSHYQSKITKSQHLWVSRLLELGCDPDYVEESLTYSSVLKRAELSGNWKIIGLIRQALKFKGSTQIIRVWERRDKPAWRSG